jgi:hypothetical protein
MALLGRTVKVRNEIVIPREEVLGCQGAARARNEYEEMTTSRARDDSVVRLCVNVWKMELTMTA